MKKHLIDPAQLFKTAAYLQEHNPINANLDPCEVENKIMQLVKSLSKTDAYYIGTGGCIVMAEDLGDDTTFYHIYADMGVNAGHSSVYVDLEAYA